MQNSVARYLEKTARAFSDRPAIVDKNGVMTFGELRANALMIGKAISERLGTPKNPVFVYLPKSAKMVSAFIGILYSGNFYTPTDVNFPFQKVKGILDALTPALIVTDSKHGQFLTEHGVDAALLLNIELLADGCEDTLYLEKTIDTDIAYVLFTSGSTGIPKGVIISHRSIIDYIDWAKACYGITENNVANQAPFYFDNSTLDIYLMLSCGATLHIVPERYYSFPAKLMAYVRENQINTIFWVPSVFINVANADILSRMDCTCLRTILFAGEITVDCTYYIVDRDFADSDPLPIGIPCPNTGILVLDGDKLVTEAGQIGELCVRGTSLALGYWNNPGKTAEVFIQNPLNNRYPEKIYCTGDLVHYNERGEIMYDGRKDFQIKHMGYRIELGEIETAALGLEVIKDACVLYDNLKKEISIQSPFGRN